MLSAQATDDAPPPPPMPLLQAGMPGPGGPPPEFFGEGMEVLGFGGVRGGKVVTNAPFSATATTTQTLADGNHISRTANVSRDSQGRVSRQVTLPGAQRSFVVISDPVAGKQYMLQPNNKVAYEMPARGTRHPNASGNRGPGNHEWKGRGEANVQKESLGTKMIGGVSADGTRFTRTIPAGQMGNEKPITIVSERWYSPDLQMVVMSSHSDPRFGQTTYTLTSIQRTEPPAANFTVPSDYTVKQGGPRGMGRFRGGPPPANAPAAPSDSPSN
jgi:hypothetical protein